MSGFVCLSVPHGTATGYDSAPALLNEGWACVVADYKATVAAAGGAEGYGPDATSERAPLVCQLHSVDALTADLSVYSPAALEALAWRELLNLNRTAALDRIRAEALTRS